MPVTIQFHSAQPTHASAIRQLLQQVSLPIEDLPDDLPDFVVAQHDTTVVGVAGLQRYDGLALLRSVAVAPTYRNRGIADRLVSRLLHDAREWGLSEVYLITTTAGSYFTRHGFGPCERRAVPEVIRQTDQFSSLCPTSASIMKRSV